MAAGQGKRLVILLDQNIQLFYLKIQKKHGLETLAWELWLGNLAPELGEPPGRPRGHRGGRIHLPCLSVVE